MLPPSPGLKCVGPVIQAGYDEGCLETEEEGIRKEA
jgi:hypothetical protein